MEGLHLFPLSPRSRRRSRGRGVIVLDNVTASNFTNPGQPLMNSLVNLGPPPGMVPPQPGQPTTTRMTPDVTPPPPPPAAVNLRDAIQLGARRTPTRNNPGDPSPEILGIGTPSPDELVIQARGRRQIPLTFSPDVHLTPNLRQKAKISGLVTSGKSSNINRLLLPTRTSPRKRLTLTDSPPLSSGSATPSPDKMKRSPITKKFKLENTAISSSVEVTSAIKGLSREQMVHLMTKILSAHPEMTEEVRDMIPSPDLSPLEERLNYLKRNIFRALPNTRLESKTDSMAYNRVATHLVAFKKAVVDQGKILFEAHQWPALVDYCLMAWSYVKATPIWDNPPHNNVRRQCFKALASNSLQALKKGQWSDQVLLDVKIKFQSFKADSEEILACLKFIDQLETLNNNNSP